MSLAREMPASAVARHVGTTDKRIWRIIHHYVFKAMGKFDLSGVCWVGLDETASKRGHRYVTIFIDMDRESRPVIFAFPGKGKECLKEFAKFLKQQGGNVDNVVEVVCDMSPAFIAAATDQFPNAAITVDWFHVVKLFADAMDSVRRAEAKTETLPKGHAGPFSRAVWRVPTNNKPPSRNLQNEDCTRPQPFGSRSCCDGCARPTPNPLPTGGPTAFLPLLVNLLARKSFLRR